MRPSSTLLTGGMKVDSRACERLISISITSAHHAVCSLSATSCSMLRSHSTVVCSTPLIAPFLLSRFSACFAPFTAPLRGRQEGQRPGRVDCEHRPHAFLAHRDHQRKNIDTLGYTEPKVAMTLGPHC